MSVQNLLKYLCIIPHLDTFLSRFFSCMMGICIMAKVGGPLSIVKVLTQTEFSQVHSSLLYFLPIVILFGYSYVCILMYV